MQTRPPKAPHPMDGAKGSPTKAPSRATKASPLTTPSRVKVPTHLTKAGQPAQCQVMLNSGTQCSNPSRHHWVAPQGGLTNKAEGWSCTTHGKRIAAGAILKWTKADKAYDPTLWGGTLKAPQQAPKAPQQAPKAPKATKATPDPQQATGVNPEAAADLIAAAGLTPKA